MYIIGRNRRIFFGSEDMARNPGPDVSMKQSCLAQCAGPADLYKFIVACEDCSDLKKCCADTDAT